ncbi:ribbon-helix-helix domain-containing protein [Bacillus sp. BPN334]|uniref:ribbon-helix-helix domain-containing protein n=1 Tax=Bacillus sp. BPN334 TaxID=2217815 RepID=UPI0011F0154D|nr:ribbon-helix-helix domain-containing protein [Bacillus sp. BPN334]KAA0794974.1 ribbon-helix-helix domain-containing protein [Bacillus sp. BPN334]
MTKKKQYKVVNRKQFSTTLANDLNEKLEKLKEDTNIPKTRLLDQAVSLLLLFQSNSTNAFISEMNELKEKRGFNSSEMTDYILNSLTKE